MIGNIFQALWSYRYMVVIAIEPSASLGGGPWGIECARMSTRMTHTAPRRSMEKGDRLVYIRFGLTLCLGRSGLTKANVTHMAPCHAENLRIASRIVKDHYNGEGGQICREVRVPEEREASEER